MDSNEPVKEYGAGLRAILNRDFLTSPKYFEQQHRAVREGAHPRLLEFTDAMIKRMAKLGVPMFAHTIVRTPHEQQAAYVQGRSQRSGTMPYAHRFAAVDLIHSVKGWDLPEQSWDLIGHIGFEVAKKLSLAMTWGGDWDGDGDKHDQKLYDPAHWELAFWKQMDPKPPFASRYGK